MCRRKMCLPNLCSIAPLALLVLLAITPPATKPSAPASAQGTRIHLHKKHGVPWNPGSATSRVVDGELVHCAAPCDSAVRERRALVWRAPRGWSPNEDLKAASYALAAVLSHPLELHWWPYKGLNPFYGPFLALVSTRPENTAQRQRIRQGWGNTTRYPPGSFRRIFFLAAPRKVDAKSAAMTEMLLNESNQHLDMTIEAWDHSSTRAMMLEWAPQYAQSTRLVFWARDNVAVEAEGLMERMLQLATQPGDVFGRVSAPTAHGTQADDGLDVSSPWYRLDPCAYFLKMGALARMSAVYDDIFRSSAERDQHDLVTPSLAHRANLSLVPIKDFVPCSQQQP